MKMRVPMQAFIHLIYFTVVKTEFSMYKVTAFNPRERASLYSLQMRTISATFINGVSNEAAITMNVIVKNKITNLFEEWLQSLDIEYTFIKQITLQQILTEPYVRKQHYISNAYCDWEDILLWNTIKQKQNPFFEMVVFGKTYEKRDIFLVKSTNNNEKKPIVFIVGGEDGMDWLSSSIILNFLNGLYKGNSELQMLSKSFSFYLVPILNPDGFVYSKNVKFQDRFWSKNRRVIDNQAKCNDQNVSRGVNIARNWFSEKSSKVPDEECNSVYIGPKSLSEEETQSLAYVVQSLATDTIAFINLRGFGRYITLPYSQPSDDTNNKDIVMEILKSTCSKVHQKHGTKYFLGPTSRFFYNFSGNMADWIKKKLNIPLVYTLYLEDIETILNFPKNFTSIVEEFITILNESLLLTKDIYGPLFNSHTKISWNLLSIIKFFILHLFFTVIQENYNKI